MISQTIENGIVQQKQTICRRPAAASGLASRPCCSAKMIMDNLMMWNNTV